MFIESPRFPVGISYGASGGPGYSTDVVVVNSGHETRNQNWQYPLASYDVAHGIKDQAEITELIKFFRNAKGRAHAFRFKDWSDYTAADGEGVFTPTGVVNEWQMLKAYTSGSLTEYRTIKKPVSGTVVFGGGGTYTLDTTTGKVTKTAGADPTGWTGEFDVPCRFDTDKMNTSIEHYNLYTWGQIPLVEVPV